MKRLALVVVFVLGVGAVAAASALASEPTPPPGCQFDGGITSCITATSTTSELAPTQFGQETIGSTTDGSGAAIHCGQQGASFYRLDTLFVAVLLTKTTTTVTRHYGAPNSNGATLPPTTTTSTVASVYAGQVTCF
jgi:hypothetical protein